MLIQILCRLQRDASEGEEITGRLVDLDHAALTHIELCKQIAAGRTAQARPAMQRQEVGVPICPIPLQGNFLMMTITDSIGESVNVSQCLGMAEIARFAERQMESNGLSSIPILGNGKRGPQNEVLHPGTPILV